MQDKRCSACARTFGCGSADPDCWCVARPALPASRLVAGADCLCPECLAAALAAPPADPRDDAPPDPAR